MPKTGRGIDAPTLMNGDSSPLNQGFLESIKKGYSDNLNTLKKLGRTGLRTLGDVGVQAVDLIIPDASTGPGSGGTASNRAYNKEQERDHYKKTRQMIKEGKIYDTGTADLFED
jgi:hypothetical protein